MSLAWIWLSGIFSLVIIPSGLCQVCQKISIVIAFKTQKRVSEQTFLTLKTIGLQQCSIQCLLRSRCQSVGYNITNLTCELDETDNFVADISFTDYMTSSRSVLVQYEAILLKGCAGHTCDVSSICVDLSSGLSSCIPIENVIPASTTQEPTLTTSAEPSTTFPTLLSSSGTPTTLATVMSSIEHSTTVPTAMSSVEHSTTVPTAMSSVDPLTTVPIGMSSSETSTTVIATPGSIACGDPPLVSGAVTPTYLDRSVGITLIYTCQAGMVTKGDTNTTCRPDVTWSNMSMTCTTCDTQYFVYNETINFCYRVETVQRFTYADAMSYCNSLGGKLAKVDTQEKIEVLLQAGLDVQAYVDGTDIADEGTWIYEDGSNVNMDLFNHPNSPAIDNSSNCLSLRSLGFTLDISCTLNKYSICEQL